MTPRGAAIRAGVAVCVTIAVIWAARVDVVRLAGGIKGDEATYISMALSVAHDRDLEYGREDYQRFRALLHSGPNGIFLKRTSADASHLEYGKSFAYPVAAAPFVGVFGLNGLLVFNVLLLFGAFACAIAFARARLGGVAGTLMGVAFVAASVVPIYTAWFTPELFNFTIVLAAYYFWFRHDVRPTGASAGRGWLTGAICAALLGIATFSKLSNALLIAPLLLVAMCRRQWIRLLVLAGCFVIGSAGLFGVNRAISGEWNYQGGAARESFSGPDRFPFDDRGTTFDSSAGREMATNQANDEGILSPDAIAQSLPRNAFYFFVGRHSGLLPYYFPGVVVLVWGAVRLRRAPIWQWGMLLSWAGSCLALLLITPGSWNGGGGPVGNRYFVSIYPTLLFLLPSATQYWPAILSAAGGWIAIGAVLLHPFEMSHAVWAIAERWPLRALPIELTIVNDLPVRLFHDRSRIPVSEDPVVYLYYMDGNTYYQEANGFWVAGGATAEIVVHTEVPLTRLDLIVRSPIENTVDISIDSRSKHLRLRPNEEQGIQLRPNGCVKANNTCWTVWRITTAAGFRPQQFDPASADARNLGVFITPKYSVK